MIYSKMKMRMRINTDISILPKAKLLLLALALCLMALLPVSRAGATGNDAYFGLSPGGSYTVGQTFTVQITETSSAGDNVNAVQANLSYPTSVLQYDSSSINGPFNICAQGAEGGNPSCFSNGISAGSVDIGVASTSTVSGTQNVASVTFTILTATSTSTSSGSPVYFGLTSGSNIDNTGGGSVWNGALTGAAFTFSAPSSGGGGTGGGGTGGGTSGSTKSTTTKSSSSSSSSTTKPTTTTTTTTPSTTTTTTPTTTTTTTPINVLTSTPSSLSITVTNDQSKPVVGATVALNDGQSGKTNSYGVVSFPGITPGKYTVAITSPGKKPITTSVVLGKGQNKLVTYKLNNKSSVTTTEIIIGALVVIALIAGAIILRSRMSGGGSQGKISKDGLITVSSPTSSSTPSGNTENTEQPTVIQPSQSGNSQSNNSQPSVSSQNVGGSVISPDPTTHKI